MQSKTRADRGRTVDVCISRLRTKLLQAGLPAPIRTVRTLGYLFEQPKGLTVAMEGAVPAVVPA